MPTHNGKKQSSARKMAVRRLQRDLVELEQANLSSIAARPLEANLFEWHVNIKPADGVYSGVYFHLVMIFPETYPTMPPEIKIKTPIEHPNVYGDWLCLSMLREHTTDAAYEGWSGAYSASSILMQLQSFLFAENVDQDGGYQAKACLSGYDVQHSLRVCKQLHCTCGHSHKTPWPAVKEPEQVLVNILPTHPEYGAISTQGSACQSTDSSVVGAYGDFACRGGRVMYEAYISWMPQSRYYGEKEDSGGRFGFGSKIAGLCGINKESFGYGSLAGKSSLLTYDNKPMDVLRGKKLKVKDTITVAVDMEQFHIHIGVNGELTQFPVLIPEHLRGETLFPVLSLKRMRVEFNFGTPRKPVKELIEKDFMTFEDIVFGQSTAQKSKKQTPEKQTQVAIANAEDSESDAGSVDWTSQNITDWLWLDIFVSLQSPEIYRCRSVCQQWRDLISKFNIVERNEMCCFFTKRTLKTATLGIGMQIAQAESGYGVEIKTQMDILSLSAWTSGCRTGVWGESMTHFLPLVMNRAHSDRSVHAIRRYLGEISTQIRYYKQSASLNTLEKAIARNVELQMVDSLVTMMNAIVVQFAMGSDKFVSDYAGYGSGDAEVPMTMCEKVVLGYSALHHLLLYLQHRNKAQVTWLANETVSIFVHRMRTGRKDVCKDLGKLLIYLLLSDYSWRHIAKTYVEESFTRRVKWMVQQPQYAKYDTTDVVKNRAQMTFEATQTSRRLAMFQVWFMQNNSQESLQSYNLRLGRPDDKVRHGVLAQTKHILGITSWWQYFIALGVELKDDAAIDQLMRFAVYNSAKKGYHRRSVGGSTSLPIKVVVMPPMVGGTPGDIQKPGQGGSRSIGRFTLKVSSKPKSNPWTGRKWMDPDASVPKPTRPGAKMPMSQSTHPTLSSRANAQARLRHIMARPHSSPSRSTSSRVQRVKPTPAQVQKVVGSPPQHVRSGRQARYARYGQLPNATQPGRTGATADANAKPLTAVVAVQQRKQAPLKTTDTAPSQMVPPAAAAAPEIVSVSPASSRPSTSSSKQYAYADNSKANSVTDESVISARSSLSSESARSFSRARRIAPLVPSELTAKRDVYDFRLKRSTTRTIAQRGIVTRQLQTVKAAVDGPVEISLRNTLGLGLEHVGSAARQQNFELGTTIRLGSKLDADVRDCEAILSISGDVNAFTYYPHAVQQPTQPMQPTQGEAVSEQKKTVTAPSVQEQNESYLSKAKRRRRRRKKKVQMEALPKLSKAQKRRQRRKALRQN